MEGKIFFFFGFLIFDAYAYHIFCNFLDRKFLSNGVINIRRPKLRDYNIIYICIFKFTDAQQPRLIFSTKNTLFKNLNSVQVKITNIKASS
jgi:hypothetical protein